MKPRGQLSTPYPTGRYECGVSKKNSAEYFGSIDAGLFLCGHPLIRWLRCAMGACVIGMPHAISCWMYAKAIRARGHQGSIWSA